MGCFSFICKKSGEPVLSNSYNGDAVYLFLLKKGRVVECMYGEYDSYGRVFDKDGNSFEWEMDWGEVCDLIDSNDKSDGICAILEGFYNPSKHPFPTEQSEDDPDQGWGEHRGFIPLHKDKKSFHVILTDGGGSKIKY